MPNSAAIGGAQIHDVLTSLTMPTHARLLEPLIEDHFAARFGDAAADRVATTFAVGKVHVLAILFQVVQPRVVILFRTLQLHPTFLLGRTGDHFRHAVAVVPEHMPLLPPSTPVITLVSLWVIVGCSLSGIWPK